MDDSNYIILFPGGGHALWPQTTGTANNNNIIVAFLFASRCNLFHYSFILNLFDWRCFSESDSVHFPE